MDHRWALGVLMVLGLFFWSLVPPVHGESNVPPGTLTVRPAKIEVSLNPGERKTTTISLTNSTSQPLTITTEFEDVAPKDVSHSGEEIASLLGAKDGQYSLKEFLQTPMSIFTIRSGDTVQLPVSVTSKPGDRPAGKYGSVVFRAVTATDMTSPREQNVAIETRIAVLYFVKINGAINESGTLEKFSVFNDERFVAIPSTAEPLMFQVVFNNTGDVHLNPYGVITVKGLFTSPVVSVIEPYAVYPGVTRLSEVALTDDIFPGYYRATLELNRGYQDQIDSEEVWFVVLPGVRGWVIMIVVAIIFFLVFRRSLRISRNIVSS